MINCALFTTLFNLVSKNSTVYRRRESFFYFCTIDTEEYIEYYQISGYISPSASYNRPLHRDTLRKIQLCQYWDCKIANSENVFEKVKPLYIKYIPKHSVPDTLDEALSNLIRFCFTGDYRIFDPFLELHNPIKRTKKQLFIGRSTELKKLHDLLQKHHKVCISGAIGIGKTAFVKEFCCKYAGNFHSINYITYKHTLSMTLETLKFFSPQENIKEKKADQLLNIIHPDSLLIIDDVNETEDNLNSIFEQLSVFPVNIIVVSRTPHIFADIEMIRLHSLDTHSLSKIVKQGKNDYCDLEDIQEFIRLTDYNTFCCAAISKTLRYCSSQNSDTYFKVLRNICTFHQTGQQIDKLDFPKYRMTYDNKESTYWGHIKAVVYSFPFSDDDHTKLSFLSFFGTAPLSREYLGKTFSIDSTWIEKMIDYGVFIKETSSEIKICQLVSDSSFLCVPKTRVYNLFCNYISSMTETLEDNVPDWNIAPALVEFTKHMNPYIKTINNEGQQTVSKDQGKWCKFIFSTLNFLNDNGYHKQAFEIIKTFINSNSELLHRQTDFTTAVHSFYASWIEGDAVKCVLCYRWIEAITKNTKGLSDDSDYLEMANHFLQIILNHILLDIMQCEQYTFTAELYTHYHFCFLNLNKSVMSPELYDQFLLLDGILDPQNDHFYDSVNSYKDYLIKNSLKSHKIRGLSILITIYFRIIQNLLDELKPRYIVQAYNNNIVECKYLLDQTIKSIERISSLDSLFALCAYSNYAILFANDPDTYFQCNEDMDHLIAKTPHADREESCMLKDTLLKLNHQTT